MESIRSVERHDYREIARVTITDEAAAALRAWKQATWTEFHGHGTGETAAASGEQQELLAAIGERVAEYALAKDWSCGIHPISGSYHAVIVGASGQTVHATYVDCAAGRYSLAG